MSEPLLIARTPDTELFLLPGMANRHGLITAQRGRVNRYAAKTGGVIVGNRRACVYG